MLYIPDTNILVYALGKKAPYSDWLNERISKNELAISVISVAEFLSGSNDLDGFTFKQFVQNFDVLSIDSVVAQIAGGYRKTYLEKTKKVWLTDCLIAATCKVSGATLATNNKSDFPMKDIQIFSDFK